MIERRSFLKGLLIGVPTATTALVQLASAEDMALLTPYKDVTIGQPLVHPSLDAARRAFLESPELYAKFDNNFVKVGYMTGLNVSTSTIEASSWHSSFRVDVPALREIIGTMEGAS